MTIRRYKKRDVAQLCNIYYDTIHNVNCADYTQAELDAWAPKNTMDEAYLLREHTRFAGINPFVAEDDGTAVGFAELEDMGHINCFYVHHLYRYKGIGSALLNACEAEAKKLGYDKLVAEVSITSKSFFLGKGFVSLKPLVEDVGGLPMKFYLMEKDISG